MPLSLHRNLMANSASRHLAAHYSRLADSVRRLSTGLRVDRAADDAAGLAVRELMRADMASLHQGARNANDAISLIQTADGALGVIDEKLIRMRELAEQAATGTYDSVQRQMIDSEFQQMASEIERIAHATDFNGITLLDGSLSGPHDGSGLQATGALKIHFGTGNDSAEDYYYIDIGDATLSGLGLMNDANAAATGKIGADAAGGKAGIQMPPLNDFNFGSNRTFFDDTVYTMQDALPQQGVWYSPRSTTHPDIVQNFIFIIPKGTKNIVINTWGTSISGVGDQDIELFTKNGVHLAGTPLDDFVFNYKDPSGIDNTITGQSGRLGFTQNDYDGSQLNSGPATYDPSGATLEHSTYNGMTIGYSGDPDRHEDNLNDGILNKWDDYEVLTIDEATEDLVFWMPGAANAYIKAYWNLPDAPGGNPGDPDPPVTPPAGAGNGELMSIKTQELAQQGIVRLKQAIVRKDQIRAHLGAIQNRLENTVTNISIQAENLQAAESRISDADIATEMTTFVRNQILTQSSVAMLSQANSFPHMLLQLLE